MGYTLELTEAAKGFLADKGYDPKFGARPLHRAIQRYLEDPLAEEILNAKLNEGDVLIIDLDDDDKITITKKEPTQEVEQ